MGKTGDIYVISFSSIPYRRNTEIALKVINYEVSLDLVHTNEICFDGKKKFKLAVIQPRFQFNGMV